MNLTGKRVVITRPRVQAQEFANALTSAGALPIFFPVIEILPPADFLALDSALQQLTSYDWLIFTSVHAVDAFFDRLQYLEIGIVPHHMRVTAVGPKTAQRLSAYGMIPDLIPAENVAEAIITELSNEISGKRFLLPQSDLARDTLAKSLRAAGGFVDEVIVYRNVSTQPDASALGTLCTGVDIITFTSPSTVRNFITIIQQHGFDPRHIPGTPLFACIGPVTKKAASEAGLPDVIVAKDYATDGLIHALKNLEVS